MPATIAHIYKRGLNFTKAYVTTPWCCPSRATIFTGLFARNHGVVNNDISLDKSTVTEVLHGLGYFTGIVGKYLNSWDGSARPEFDFWRVFKGGNTSYINLSFNENGIWRNRPGHIARVMEAYLLEFLGQAASTGRPFLLYWAPNMPHRPAIPEPQYQNTFAGFKTPKRNNTGCRGRLYKPNYVKRTPCNSTLEVVQKRLAKAKELNRRQLQTLLSVDDVIAKLISALETKGMIERTVVFFIADNGLLRGAFGLIDKPYPYEDAIRVPFAVRYDRLIEPGRESAKLVGNLDIAPTIYELAGAVPPYPLNGRSLLPLFRGSDEQWRETLLFESYTDRRIDGRMRKPFVGLTDGRYTLIVNMQSIIELYDLDRDPDQIRNLFLRERQRARAMFKLAATQRPEIASGAWLNTAMQRYLGVGTFTGLDLPRN